jgi:hypothetical protein
MYNTFSVFKKDKKPNVMAGLDPAIHALPPPFARLDVYLTSSVSQSHKSGFPWMAGSSLVEPGHDKNRRQALRTL